MKFFSLILLSACSLACGSSSGDRPLRVAVAANFAETAGEIADRYERATGNPVELSVGATGAQFNQILNGAPFDVFLAADTTRPALLDSLGLTIPGTRFTYALGSLVLWAKRQEDLPTDALESVPGKRLAMANPRLAPYGVAAQETLVRLGIADDWEDRIVMGESVAQAFQFARTRSVDFGLVAESQVRATGGLFWRIPDSLYTPIRQQAVQLTEHPDARPFLALLRSREIRDLMEQAGYRSEPRRGSP